MPVRPVGMPEKRRIVFLLYIVYIVNLFVVYGACADGTGVIH